MKMEGKAVVIGSLNYDIILKTDRMPYKGETHQAKSAEFCCGGKGGNQAVQCARLGIKTYMAGNVGTQSLAVTIRVLVDENLTTAKKLQLLWKEMRVGLTNGALLAVLALGFLGCYIHFFKAYAWGEAFLLSGCVGVSLVVAMVISSLVGTVIPMLFHKIHIDPAVASGPLITTINDLVAVVVYYGLAAVVLIDMFHLG